MTGSGLVPIGDGCTCGRRFASFGLRPLALPLRWLSAIGALYHACVVFRLIRRCRSIAFEISHVTSQAAAKPRMPGTHLFGVRGWIQTATLVMVTH